MELNKSLEHQVAIDLYNAITQKIGVQLPFWYQINEQDRNRAIVIENSNNENIFPIYYNQQTFNISLKISYIDNLEHSKKQLDNANLITQALQEINKGNNWRLLTKFINNKIVYSKNQNYHLNNFYFDVVSQTYQWEVDLFIEKI
ncbi:Uncharacterised protein [Mesomycoplasma conjunctivae]|uniref:Uncharacterized protein n=1 Tax=Mesomycoplasma conjunctivae (strain ATCC 25834 / NCTC 10147 / HRC/581) TaxID=572263 RepID=C5J6S9_MESCH|nr:hypothetical protein [Mesomycoplasma conjunctivae]CAT05192.1 HYPOTHETICAL PROTEIN MCJ_004870 [Mesomycoplasma conjunctivae]VEU66197.1 Uncharacterised protein [Mesomycoplasma conjunctivae]VEU66403.1 Uncharacterised protein [Mesomycoplasma conjunctivae]